MNDYPYLIDQRDADLLHSTASVHYHCSFARAAQHLLEVRMEVDVEPNLRYQSAGGQRELELIMPSWTPGSYKIRDFVSHQGNVRVSDELGNALEFHWEAKDACIVSIPDAQTKRVIVEYSYYANERTVRTMHINRWRAFINPVNCLMYVEGHLDQVHHVHVHLDATDWQQVSTALSPVEASGASHPVFAAKNYDVLADSPLEVGNHRRSFFTAAGASHEVALVSSTELDITWLTEKCKTIVETEAAMFGGVPYDRYVFMVQVGTNVYGGLEHSRCSVNLVDSSTMTDPSKSGRLLALLCHEYFHTWNVKRIRPIELGPFNYRRENYTPMLWLAEGFTSYYDDLFSYRCGFMDRDAYLATLRDDHLAKLEAVPGRHAMTTVDASFLAWVKLYAQSPDGNNRYPSYYLKGGVLTLLLELAIIARTKGAKRLDDVMRAFMQRFEADPAHGMDTAEAVKLIDTATGLSGVGQEYLDLMQSCADPDYNSYLRPFGLQWSFAPKVDDNERTSCGWSLREESGRLFVSFVQDNTPAALAGIGIDDEILAVSGRRVQSSSALLDALKSATEHAVMLECSCDGKLYETTIRPEVKPQAVLERVAEPGAEQDRLLDLWLLR